MNKFSELSRKKYFMPACITVITCYFMYLSVRWILMQETDFYWLAGRTVSRISYIVSCLFLALLTAFIFAVKDRIKPEVLFLILYFFMEIMYMGVIPLSSTPDETEHMLRSYGISQGDFVPESTETGEGGSYVPANITYMWNRGGSTLKDMKDNLLMEADDNRVFLTYSNTALYSPITYTPQAVGIFIGRLICNKPYVWAYMGRFFNMMTVGILIFFAIKITPVGKNIIFALSMLPINMYESASLSGGPLAYAVTVLIIAYTLWHKYVKDGKMNKRETACLYLILLFSASCKIVYVPFVLMAFIIPVERFENKKKYAFHIICAAVMILLASLGWVSISSRYLIEYTSGVDSFAQAKYVIMHPFMYMQTIVNTFMQVGEWIIKTFFAAALGYFDVAGSYVMIVVSAVNLIYVCVNEKLNICVSGDKGEGDAGYFRLPAVMMALAALISGLFVLTSEYVQWTPYMNPSIDGLQGRYFLPLIFPLVLIVKKKTMKKSGDRQEDLYDPMPCSKLFICFINLITIVTLFIHYA